MSKKKHLSKLRTSDPKLSGTKPLFNQINLEKYLNQAITYLSLALAFVALATSSYFFFPAVFVKTFLFYGIIEIIVALFIFLALLNKRYWPRFTIEDANGQKNINWLLVLPSAYVGAAILSTFFSTNLYNSFFGSVDWSNGLLTLLHFWGLFIVLTSTLRKKSFWLHFLRLNVFVGTVISFIAMYQKFFKGMTAMGTFGNQGHFSCYLLFIIFIAAVLFFWSEERVGKIFWIGLGAINILALFLTTAIRGSQLGLIVGIIAAVAIYFLVHQKKSIRKTTAGIIIISLVLAVILSVFLVSSGKVYSIFERSGTVKTRILNWKIGGQGFLEKPIFGYGLENYYMPFEKHFEPDYYQNNSGQQSTEYGFSLPHNKIVEVAVLSGIFGLVTYLALIIGIFWLLHKKFSKTREMPLLALFGMWTAYFVHLFFLFDNIASFFMFFSLLAFTDFALKESVAESKDEKVKLNPVVAYVLMAAIAVGTIGAIYFLSYQAARADIYAISMIREMRNKEYEKSIASLEKMEDIGIFYINQKALFELSRETERMLVLANQYTEPQKKYLEQIIAKNKASLNRDPSRIYYYLNMSRIHFMAGKFDKANYEKSNELLQKMIDGGTQRMEVYMYMGQNYQALGQKEKAIELGEKGLALDPTYGYANYMIAHLYRLTGDNDKAIYYIDEAIKNGYSNKTSYSLYADAAYAKKDYDRAVIAFTALTKLDPQNPQNYANLAMVYFEKKDYAKAREVSNQIIEKFPKLREKVQAFIDNIPK